MIRYLKLYFLPIIFLILLTVTGCATQQINQLTEENRELLAKQDALADRIAELNRELANLRKDYENLKQSREEAVKENESLLTQNRRLKKELESVREELSAAEEKLAVLAELTAALTAPPKLSPDIPVPPQSIAGTYKLNPPEPSPVLTEGQIYLDPKQISRLEVISAGEEETSVLRDRETGILWYLDKSIINLDAAFYLYFGREKTDNIFLRMALKTPFPKRVPRSTESSIRITTDSHTYTLRSSLGIITRIEQTAIWFEYIDFPVTPLTFTVLTDVILSSICVLEVSTGDGYNYIRQLTEEERSSLNSILYVYRILGGDFPYYY